MNVWTVKAEDFLIRRGTEIHRRMIKLWVLTYKDKSSVFAFQRTIIVYRARKSNDVTLECEDLKRPQRLLHRPTLENSFHHARFQHVHLPLRPDLNAKISVAYDVAIQYPSPTKFMVEIL